MANFMLSEWLRISKSGLPAIFKIQLNIQTKDAGERVGHHLCGQHEDGGGWVAWSIEPNNIQIIILPTEWHACF